METIKDFEERTKRNIENPIYGTDLKRPVSVVIEEIRNDFVKARGKISDVVRAHPGWKDRLEDVSGLLTCGLVALASANREIIETEIRWDEEKHGKSYSFHPRGIGLDVCPGCFVCGKEKRTDDPTKSSYLNNISAFVKSKEEGEEICSMFGTLGDINLRPRLDYRPSEPKWIQVKVGACDQHLPNLKHLYSLTSVHGVIRQSMVEEARAYVE